MNIAIVDYGMGNLNSVKKKLTHLKVDVSITSDQRIIKKADKIILPGVGHFTNAFENLNNLHLIDILNEEVLINKKPILGICLGMQLMAKQSEEGNANGLGWINADVVKFNIQNKLHYKVPHIGWNTVSVKKKSNLFNDIDISSEFYFVHSYYMRCHEENDILNTTIYESEFVSAIEHNNIFGVQYHPEKSHDAGTKLISNFIKI